MNRRLRDFSGLVALCAAAVAGFLLIAPPARAATSALPWDLVVTDKAGARTVVRESSTLDYCKGAVKTIAPQNPAVIAAGADGVLECVLRVAGPTAPVVVPDPPVVTPSAPVSGSWVTGKSTASEPTTAKPARGVATPDPSFKLPVIRVTDRADPPKTFARNDYSRRQAFNADNTRQLVYANDGHWHTYNATTFRYEKQLNGPAGDAEPHWHATNPDLLYYVGNNGVGLKLLELNVATNTSRTASDFGARVKKLWPSATFAWTKSEGSPSADGRYWCFMVENGSFGPLGFITLDLQTDTITGSLSNSDRPDHVSMSPSGNYCVVSGDSARGTVAYSRDFKTSRKLLSKSEHSDLALLPNGDDAYVSVDYQSSAGDVFFINLRTGERTVLFTSYLSGTARAFHFSAKNFGVPGYVLVSAYGEYGGAQQWMDRKVTLVELKANPVIRNVAWTRARFPASDGYFFEPHATISRDGRRVAFTSSWGGTALGDLNAYQVQLPALP